MARSASGPGPGAGGAAVVVDDHVISRSSAWAALREDGWSVLGCPGPVGVPCPMLFLQVPCTAVRRAVVVAVSRTHPRAAELLAAYRRLVPGVATVLLYPAGGGPTPEELHTYDGFAPAEEPSLIRAACTSAARAAGRRRWGGGRPRRRPA